MQPLFVCCVKTAQSNKILLYTHNGMETIKFKLGKELDYLGIGIRFPEDKIFSLPHSILSVSGATHEHRLLFPMVKGGRSMKLNAHQHLAAKLSIRAALPALPHMTSRRGASLAVTTAEQKQRPKSRFISMYRMSQKPVDNRCCLNIWTILYSVLAIIFNRCRKGTVGLQRTLRRRRIKLDIETSGCRSAHNVVVIIIIIIIIICISPLRRVYKIVYLQQVGRVAQSV